MSGSSKIVFFLRYLQVTQFLYEYRLENNGRIYKIFKKISVFRRNPWKIDIE